MPSPIGHALAGIAIAPLAGLEARSTTPGPKTGFTPATTFAVICAALAALPDLDLVYLPIHRTVTHSVGATVLVTILAIGVTRWVTGKIDWRIGLVCGAAYGSHVLLDWLARDPDPPYGIQALWPFSREWFISGWNVFRPTERLGLWSSRAMLINLRAAVQEIAILGWVVLLTRIRRIRGRSFVRGAPR